MSGQVSGHPLDRPVWNALGGRQAGFAIRQGDGVRMQGDVGPFAAVAAPTPAGYAALVPVADAGGIATLEAEAPEAPPGLRIASSSACDQMIAERLLSASPDFAFDDLGAADAEDMLALATLTEPGPFRSRTHALGRFVGVRHGGALVAMVGERLQPNGFTEVSGVCTHPDFRGAGLAAGLMHVVAHRILDRGELPILHTYSHNKGATRLYERLGYRTRRQLMLTVMMPA
jgi:predicted GNAT family acetyltransferase